MSYVQTRLLSATKKGKWNQWNRISREQAVKSFQKYFTGRGEDGYFGNPFRMGQDSEFKHRVLALKGKRLGCFCKPKACHGDVIAE
jgi:hypothetical protein